MPDENKLGALEAAGFKIKDTCMSCRHYRISNRSGWGHCMKLPYQHGKHSDEKFAGVPMDGWCPSFDINAGFGRASWADQRGAYERFRV